MRIILLLSSFLFVTNCQPNLPVEQQPKPSIDWQGHRGARGLAPENTIPAFLLALEYQQVKTLELDVVISADQQIIVSHEPWFSASICAHPDGRPVSEEEEKQLNIYQMKLADIQAFDCGRRGHPDYPEQRPMSAIKPTLEEVIKTVEARATDLERDLPFYNIEIKSRPEWDSLYTPPPTVFANLVLSEVKRLGIQERTTVQSFDTRTLQVLHQLDSTQVLAYLIGNPHTFAANMDTLGFTPDIYSPYYLLVSDNLLQSVHEQDMLLIPWTVNDTATMRGLVELGVDGIITDYPNRIPIDE